jgi:uncharacterized protein with PCYCGC motif
MRRTTLVAAGVVAVTTVAVGVWFGAVRGGESASLGSDAAEAGFAARFAGYEPAPEPNGDLSKVVWPDYVLKAGSEVKRLYEFQITHGDLMRYMPCFCGCGQNAGHRSNRDCYVRRVNPDGSVVFDSMAPT